MLTPNKNINHLDLADVKRRVISLYSWKTEDANTIEEQYKRFLFLKWKHPKEKLVPFQELDLFWHEHILMTKKYASDCAKIFGYFMHHNVDMDVNESQLEKNYQRTIDLFEKEFPDVE